MPLVLEPATKSLPPVLLGDPKRFGTFQIMAHVGGRLTESIPAAYATFSAKVVLWLEVWQFSNPAIEGYTCDHQFHLYQREPQYLLDNSKIRRQLFMLGAICLHGMVPTHSTLNGASGSKAQASPMTSIYLLSQSLQHIPKFVSYRVTFLPLNLQVNTVSQALISSSVVFSTKLHSCHQFRPFKQRFDSV
jgi:hypothetical protein